MTDKKFSSKYR